MIAEKEHLPLLAILPIEPEVVRMGDSGSLADLYDGQLPFTQEFNKIIKEIVESKGKEDLVVMQEKQEIKEKEESLESVIKFAIPVARGKLCAHFGHCDKFALIETENGKIKGQEMHTPPPHEPGVLPKWLHDQGADVIIAGGMGANAQQIFNENGIKVITGASGNTPESLVNQYLSESLLTGPNVCDH